MTEIQISLNLHHCIRKIDNEYDDKHKKNTSQTSKFKINLVANLVAA